MSARNAFRGPGFWNLNLGLYKTIDFSERYKLQLRGEAFNIFNHANLFFNGNTIDLASSSSVTASKKDGETFNWRLNFFFKME